MRGKKRIHHEIARRIIGTIPPERLDSKVFYAADRFNRAPGLTMTRQEKDLAVDLNLRAALKAKEATAYAAAADYLKNALQLLPGKAWKERHDPTFAIFVERGVLYEPRSLRCDCLEGHQHGPRMRAHPYHRVRVHSRGNHHRLGPGKMSAPHTGSARRP